MIFQLQYNITLHCNALDSQSLKDVESRIDGTEV